jgi:myxalamid-type polyketide synthase MxaB
LIHAAAGGVGMAAVQLARRAGAEIFGTAGSDKKRSLLKSLGVHHVMDSRSLDFHDQILSVTNGEGVDIVLNSLAGEFIPKSISILKETGCFVEIGKTDIWDEARARELKAGIAYFILYLGEILDRDPLPIKKMLLDLLADFEDGTLKPLPQQIFPIQKSVDAFRYMAQAKHTGKIVITQKPADAHSVSMRKDATYLITGGLGGLGLASARRLVEQGARHLVLVSRSAPNEETQRSLDEIEAQGVHLHIARMDVSQRVQVEDILQHIRTSMPPLKGIIHAAGLLDDGILMEQTWSRFTTVMASKVDGAWNLHTLTLGLPLDFFVLFSAGAALLGSPGQGNYAAANAFLDGLAHYRQTCGLPALSINWGAWAEVGMAAKLGNQNQRRWTAQGMSLIKPAEGLRAMERLLERQSTQMAVLPVNWQKFQGQKSGEVRPLLRLLVKRDTQETKAGATTKQISFVDQLKATPPEEQFKLLFEYVTREVNKVLGLDVTHLTNPRQGFTDIGLDSLMAVELSNRLQKGLGRPLPSTLTFEYPSIQSLTDYLAIEILGIKTNPEPEKPVDQSLEKEKALLAEVEEIPEDKLEDELLRELKDAGY